jgi:hypothetical protein
MLERGASYLRRVPASGAEGYRFEPYRAYQLINNLAVCPLAILGWGQIGDKLVGRTGLESPSAYTSTGIRHAGPRRATKGARMLPAAVSHA